MIRILLALLFIPSLSWGDNIFNKIPSTNSSIKKLYNYEIGYQFSYDKDDFYIHGDFESLFEDYPYVWIKEDYINQWSRHKRSDEDIKLSLNKDKIISSISLSSGKSNEIIFRLRELTEYETKEHLEKHIPFGKCYDELQKIKKAIKLKLNINDKFLDTYQYFPNAKEDEIILAFRSTIKSKPDDNILNLSCYYELDKDLGSWLYIDLFDSNRFNYMNENIAKDNPDRISRSTLIEKEKFKEIFEILKSDVYVLIKEL
jgi:hypothetical protein